MREFSVWLKHKKKLCIFCKRNIIILGLYKIIIKTNVIIATERRIEGDTQADVEKEHSINSKNNHQQQFEQTARRRNHQPAQKIVYSVLKLNLTFRLFTIHTAFMLLLSIRSLFLLILYITFFMLSLFISLPFSVLLVGNILSLSLECRDNG